MTTTEKIVLAQMVANGWMIPYQGTGAGPSESPGALDVVSTLGRSLGYTDPDSNNAVWAQTALRVVRQWDARRFAADPDGFIAEVAASLLHYLGEPPGEPEAHDAPVQIAAGLFTPFAAAVVVDSASTIASAAGKDGSFTDEMGRLAARAWLGGLREDGKWLRNAEQHAARVATKIEAYVATLPDVG